jgi:hypothetical protein
MACNQWARAEALAGQARAVILRAGTEDSYAVPMACALLGGLAVR